jgi:hypothetical protein
LNGPVRRRVSTAATEVVTVWPLVGVTVTVAVVRVRVGVRVFLAFTSVVTVVLEAPRARTVRVRVVVGMGRHLQARETRSGRVKRLRQPGL